MCVMREEALWKHKGPRVEGDGESEQAGEIPEESNARQWEEQERSWEGTSFI